MRIYLGEMEFPAAPEKLEAEREGGWVKTELETLGEVLQYRPSRLKRVRFGGIFPGQRMGFVTAETLLAPSRYAEILEEAMNSRESRRLVVSGGAAPFSMLAAVESFSRREQAGEDGDLYYSLTLREYRPYGLQAAVVKVSSPDGRGSGTVSAGRSGTPAVPEQYTVRAGDTLWAIAKRYLGDGSRYPEIAAANGIANPNLIYPGQVLRIV